MPSYKNYLIATSLLFLLNGCSQTAATLDVEETIKKTYKQIEAKKFIYEDQYIIFALEYENQKSFNSARHLYYKLFENTNKYEYLVKYLSLSFQLRDYKSIDQIVSNDKNLLGIKEEEEILRVQTFSLIKLKNYDKALAVSKKLVNVNSKRDINHELLGTIYLEKKEYKKSYESFEKAFTLNDSSLTMLSLTNIQFYYLNEQDKAISKLEEYIQTHGFIYNASFQLLSFYEKQERSNDIIALLKKMYKSYENDPSLKTILGKTKNLLVRYLAKNDLFEAIDFLEQKDPDNVFLVALYRTSNDLEKLYVLLEKLYNKTKNVDFLAQMAIVEFEEANDKQKVLNSVISKFEKALITLNNPVYQNYLSYLLIDFDIDIKKGIVLVKKALKKEPDNLAYIDTLAWGEYKLGNCQNAYDYMKIVVDKAGLEDEEIKLHWEKIKECIK